MKWSLNQASHETGVAKATILRAIKDGRMSANKSELGQYEIDPSEFDRVFSDKMAELRAQAETQAVPGTRTEVDPTETPSHTGWLQAELKRIAELLKMTDLERTRERERAEEEIGFLRRRLEVADSEREELAKERRTLTAQLLTYQKPPELSPPVPPAALEAGPAAAAQPPARRGLFGLFRRAG